MLVESVLLDVVVFVGLDGEFDASQPLSHRSIRAFGEHRVYRTLVLAGSRHGERARLLRVGLQHGSDSEAPLRLVCAHIEAQLALEAVRGADDGDS